MIWAAWIAFVLTQAADVWTTNRGLSQGGREANPVIAWMMRRGLWPWGKLAYSAAIAAWLHVEGLHLFILIFSGIIGLVALWNWRQAT